MSATGALLVALTAILALGALAAWLLNIPSWAIGVFLVGGIFVIRRILGRMARARARQEAEAPK